MKISARFLMAVVVPAFMFAAVAAQPATAQEKAKEAKAAKAEKGKATQKVLLENDKVRVLEITFKPGGENVSVPTSSFRVVRALKGGTLMRNYADGKTEKIEWKTGEVRMNEPSGQYTAKNVGKTEIVLYVVILKEPKK